MQKKHIDTQQKLYRIYQKGLQQLDKFYNYKPTLSLSELALTQEGLSKKRGRPPKKLKEDKTDF